MSGADLPNKAVMSARSTAQGASRAPSEFSLEFGSAMLMAPGLHEHYAKHCKGC